MDRHRATHRTAPARPEQLPVRFERLLFARLPRDVPAGQLARMMAVPAGE